MSIVFYDIEGWEEARLPQTVGGRSIVLEAGHLTEKTVSLAADAEIVSLFSWSRVTPELLDCLPRLRHIATRSTGFDHIDMEECTRRGIVVSNVPTYGERTVAEHTFALMLAVSRKILQTYDRTRRGNFSREGLRGFDLEGKTLGIVGCGKIGARVASIAQAFAMNVLVFDQKCDEALASQLGFQYVDRLEDLLSQSDVVSLHAPLTPHTRHLINMETIRAMKPGAVLINTARGDLVQTAALLKALDEGVISGAGLDVLENERLIHEEAEVLSQSNVTNQELASLLHNHILINHPKVLITPHNAFNSEEAVQKILQTTVENIEAFCQGKPQNVVQVNK